MRNEGATETYFLNLALFYGGSRSGTLELYVIVGHLCLNVSLSDLGNGLRTNH
jgi:hypothetical protein